MTCGDWIALGLIGWIVAALPLGILIGRFIKHGQGGDQ